jgi:hypothetical protein
VSMKSDSSEGIQGTLILTDKRLLLVAANKEEELDMNFRGGLQRRSGTLRFADVDDLKSIPDSKNNLSISLSSISHVSGSERILRPPILKVEWNDNAKMRHAEFSEEIMGGRKKDLRDWAKVIEGLRAGKIQITRPKADIPNQDTLGGKILSVLGDMQEKGTFEIEEEVETAFNVSLDPDQIEAACDTLVSQALLDVIPDNSGDKFYRKRSPLGQDDLSS